MVTYALVQAFIRSVRACMLYLGQINMTRASPVVRPHRCAMALFRQDLPAWGPACLPISHAHGELRRLTLGCSLLFQCVTAGLVKVLRNHCQMRCSQHNTVRHGCERCQRALQPAQCFPTCCPSALLSHKYFPKSFPILLPDGQYFPECLPLAEGPWKMLSEHARF